MCLGKVCDGKPFENKLKRAVVRFSERSIGPKTGAKRQPTTAFRREPTSSSDLRIEVTLLSQA